MALRRDPGSLDPRLANKRPASRSPDSDGPRKRPAMGFKAGESAAVNPKMALSTLISDLFLSSTAMAKLEIKLETAQTEYDRAAKEYDRVGEKVPFPAIREQKRLAKQLAEERLRSINAEIRTQQGPQGSQGLVAELSAHIEKAAAPAPAAEKPYGISPKDALRIHNLEKEVAKLQSTILSLEEKLDGIKSSTNGINGMSDPHYSGNDTAIRALESKFNDFAPIASLNEVREDYQEEMKATLDLVEANVQTLFQEHKDQSAPFFDQLQIQCEANSEAQRQSAAAIRDCLDRLKNLEASSGRQANEASDIVRQTVTLIEARVGKLEKVSAKAPVDNPGLLGFQPCVPDTNGDSGPQSNGARVSQSSIDKINSNIEMLKAMTGQHTRLINNLTTDDVVRCMVDQMGSMYPDARNFQVTVHELRQKLAEVQNRVDATVNNVRAAISPEIAQLRGELNFLKQNVDQHDTTVKVGEVQLTNMANRMQQTETDLTELKKDMIEVNELIEKLPTET